MSHFEYISVAVALILSLVISRLLSGFASATQQPRAYWVHLCWLFQSLLAAVVFWWGFWNTQYGEWTGPRFAWALVTPSLMYVKAQILVGPSPESVTSFRDYFFENRVRIFTVGLLVNAVGALTPFINGAPNEVGFRLLQFTAIGIGFNVAGLLLSGSRSHALIVVLSLLYVSIVLFLIPAIAPAN